MEKLGHACPSFLKRAKPPRYYKYLRNGESRARVRDFLKRVKPPRYYKYLRNGGTHRHAGESSETGETDKLKIDKYTS